MGWFSGSTETYVSSVVYNLAGDASQRVDYLKTAVVSTVLRHGDDYMGETIINSYKNGPGLRFRTFADWCVSSGYNDSIGFTASTIGNNGSINQTLLGEVLGGIGGSTVKILKSTMGFADFTYWAEKWILENHPDLIDTQWTSEYFSETGLIYITTADESTTYQIAPADYDPESRYLYAAYYVASGSSEGPINTGVTHTLADDESFPSTSGYTRTSNSSEVKTLPINIGIDTVVSYSDGRPNETSHEDTSTVASYTEKHAVWVRTTYNGLSSNGDILSTRKFYYFDTVGAYGAPTITITESSQVIDGVTVTTQKTYTKQTQKLARTYRLDSQTLVLSGWSQMKSLIYKQGSGNDDLDGMFAVKDAGIFFPMIPFRENTQFLSDDYMSDIYDLAKTAYRKATNNSLSKLISKVSDNDSLGDIDFGFIVFGVSLNTQEDTCKQYLLKFFASVNQTNSGTYQAYQTWKTNYSLANKSQLAYAAWAEAQKDQSNPLYGTGAPTAKAYPVLPVYTLTHASTRNDLNWNVQISFSWIRETVSVGVYREGALKGTCWVEKSDSDSYDTVNQYTDDTGVKYVTTTNTVETIRITWQETNATYRSVYVGGLKYNNLVYAGKYVTYTAYEALDDADESGFIIPLHSQVYRDMGLKVMTQMANSLAYVVFNCYTQVKTKWYQTGLFQIIVIIIIIIISVYSGGTTSGMLGTATQVGTALGFTGTAAIIVGALANAIAAMILMQVLTSASKAILGDKIGAIVGAVASVVAMSYGQAYMQGQDMSAVFSNMMKAENLIKLTAAATSGIQDYMKSVVADTVAATTQLLDNYETKSKEISEAYATNLASSGVVLDPLDMAKATSIALEYPDSFFTRTLMTGSDIAFMQDNLLTNFVSLTLSQSLPI